jgi:hypothetical protein
MKKQAPRIFLDEKAGSSYRMSVLLLLIRSILTNATCYSRSIVKKIGAMSTPFDSRSLAE